MRNKIYLLTLLVFIFSSCKKDKAIEGNLGYPEDVSQIITTKCSITGCHTTQAKEGAGGLDLSTWDALFEGGHSGSVVIPYRPDLSWFINYINTDTNRGVALSPTMPYNAAPLSNDEYYTLQNWVAAGAPNGNGDVAFCCDPNRSKFYVTNQGCDLVAVFDAKTLLAMRYIDVGATAAIESPHQIKISPDGKYWYVIFVGGTVMQKFNTSDDSKVADITIGAGNWNTMVISPDGNTAYVVDFSTEGKIARVDLQNNSLIGYYQGSGLFLQPHGINADSSFTHLYCTAQSGNFIYKLDITNPDFPDITQVVLAPGETPNIISSYDPHEILFSPDGSKYFVTCQTSGEVRVMDATTDTLIKIIPVGTYANEMSISHTHPYMFVTCMEDPCSQSNCKGSVYVIDYSTLDVIKVLQDALFEPHGIAVNDAFNTVAVANRNYSADGPAPHHTSDCGGRNGFMRFIDMSTLDFIPGLRPEISVDPYSVASR